MRPYRNEYTMLDVPPLVQRFVFPLVVGLGMLLGKYRKYREAPAPHRD
ncbi:hypothetical protein Strain138_001160 [Pseudogemmatithrix spongiicola]|uniref:Uncharacterized protein n=1 Tax=Pseudogemmatithrix spongiicola TaxID=3062599 RepID=A0AA49Q786_9BACT|nr:hypothetical protein Strain138_001160 [Gemmatimonadaceae bacterium 'strain 138']WKW14802.1 hypothetical protein Strain318_001160 [Gemmatimonadaceae bacterium 'strain 318']